MSKSSQKNQFSFWKSIVSFCKRQDWEDFLMKFLSVFLGIVLTFTGNAWISNQREKNDICEALQMVQNEMKDNLNHLKTTNTHIKEEAKAAYFLSQYFGKFETCPTDSMKKYCNIPLTISTFKPSTEALELLKTSALLSKIRDKQLALDIIRAYNYLANIQEGYKYYNDKKQKIFDNAMQEEAKALFAQKKFNGAEMWTAITSTSDGKQYLNEIVISYQAGFGYNETKEYLEEIIKKLEEATK